MEKFDLEDWINEFLAVYNDIKHSTTKLVPRNLTEMTHDKEMLAKVK